VDDVLDRLAYEIDVRERRIAELEGREPSQQAETQVTGPAAGHPAETAQPPEVDG
jgi:hypothetical protein